MKKIVRLRRKAEQEDLLQFIDHEVAQLMESLDRLHVRIKAVEAAYSPSVPISNWEITTAQSGVNNFSQQAAAAAAGVAAAGVSVDEAARAFGRTLGSPFSSPVEAAIALRSERTLNNLERDFPGAIFPRVPIPSLDIEHDLMRQEYRVRFDCKVSTRTGGLFIDVSVRLAFPHETVVGMRPEASLDGCSYNGVPLDLVFEGVEWELGNYLSDQGLRCVRERNQPTHIRWHSF